MVTQHTHRNLPCKASAAATSGGSRNGSKAIAAMLSIATLLNITSIGCACKDASSEGTQPPATNQLSAAQPISAKPGEVRLDGRPPYAFSREDEEMLDRVSHGAFNFLYHAVNPTTKLVPDRLKNPRIVSVAGVGFQLSSLPIGIERGWITREQGEQRAKDILHSLTLHPEIVKAGLYQHFIDADTAGMHSDKGLEHVVSTIDSALLMCGLITASSYFGGDIAASADKLFARADFTYFVGSSPSAKPWEAGYISLGWKPDSVKDGAGQGKILPYYWIDSGCEHRLTAFLAVAAPNEAHRLPPSSYYKLRRAMGDAGGRTVAWFPYSGALFTNQFSHCWINYSAQRNDKPADYLTSDTPRTPIDWWQNSRDMTLFQRERSIALSSEFTTLNENAWGFTASDCAAGYCVPGVFPAPLPMPGSRARFDYATDIPKDQPGDGTVAPYAAGTSIMFTPAESLAALKHYITIKDPKDGRPLFTDPNVTPNGFGFADAYNSQHGWYAEDYVSIDQGPMLLAIENARTGFIWKLFHSHPAIKSASQRLGWQGQ